MNRIYYLVVFLIFTSCTNNDDIIFDKEANLSNFLIGKTYSKDAVIACAASSKNDSNIVNVYFYPEIGSSNFRLYESNINNGKDFSKYVRNEAQSQPFFNGTLGVFKVNSNAAWLIVVYDLHKTIKLATPIKNKKNTQPSLWTSEVDINQQESRMPLFIWDVNSEETNAVFFQVLANKNLDLLSGTYTNENKFQYYKLDNVVLNITQNTPPELILGNDYLFTVMDVSLDNWVNEVIMKTFVAE
jgi:hypothetical protein